MNKGIFSGWKDVFSFTFKQGLNAKNFKAVTTAVALLALLGGMAISVIMAFVQKKDATEVSPIEVVHVMDESGLDVLYTEGFLENYQKDYPTISFQMAEGTVQEVNDSVQGENDVILHLSEEGEGFLMTLYLPESSLITENEGQDFLDDVMIVMEQSKLFSSGIEMEKLVFAMSGISGSILDAGEAEKSVGEELVVMLFPMLSVLFLYIMTLVYGQSMGNIVSVEKTSKLMEMMLTLTRPYGLIMGKIFATASIAIIQMLLWVGSLVAGFFLGHYVADNMIYADYQNALMEVFKLLGDQEGSTAFSVGSILLAIFTICLSFLFYCVLAGMIASFATKAENLAQVMSYYQLFVIAGFFGAYMVPLQEKEWLNTLMRIIPVTSAYMLPGDLVVGNVKGLESILYVGILLVTTVVLVVLTGKIYKNQLFYRGTGLLQRFKKKK